MQNFTSAFNSLWHNKVRSFLTLLGVIIGVASVTTLVSLGQGLKNDVANLVQGFGTNVITVIAGNLDVQGGQGMQQNPANFVSGDILTVKDVEAIDAIGSVDAVTPVAIVPGSLRYEENLFSPTLMATYPNVSQAFEILSIEQGRMFEGSETNVIVLSRQVADQLIPDDDALGKKVTLNDQEFEVVGVLSKPKSSSIFGSEFDTVTLIPFAKATEFTDGREQVNRIVVNAGDAADVESVKAEISDALLQTHQGKDDFSVLTQDDMLGLLDQFLTMATALVSAIAAISLIVGGIGIMNIMLVTVTERTREIGLRKAVGATKRDILVQFLIEAVVLTLLGGIIGLGIAFLVGQIVAANTPLVPSITLEVVLLATGISTVVGLLFGLWPAINAANKTPIEALRYE